MAISCWEVRAICMNLMERIPHFAKSDFETIRSMIESRNGDLWIVDDRQIYCLRDHIWISYTPDDGLIDSGFLKIFEDSRGYLAGDSWRDQ